MEISFSETRFFSFNLVLLDLNENFFIQSRVSRRDRERENHFSRSFWELKVILNNSWDCDQNLLLMLISMLREVLASTWQQLDSTLKPFQNDICTHILSALSLGILTRLNAIIAVQYIMIFYLDEVIDDPGGWSDVFPDIFVYLIRFSEFYSNTAISWLSLNVKDVKTSSKGVWNYNLWATIVSAVLSAASYYWTNFCSNLCLDLHQGCQQLRKQGGKREDWIKSVFLPALLYVNVRYKSLMIKNVQQICLFLKAILLTMEMLHCLHF